MPRSVIEDRETGIPFIVHGLLRHEHKQSVLHFVVQRNTEYAEPVKAKVSDRLFIHLPIVDISFSGTLGFMRRSQKIHCAAFVLAAC